MSSSELAEAAPFSGASRGRSVNDFSIHVATVNGSGSQTANLVLMRAIFRMGIPVSGKNLFPSNIAGLPTWFTIRASKRGYIGRKREVDVLVAMNPETAAEDVAAVESGGLVVYDEPLKLDRLRSDVNFYPVPFDELVKPVCPEPKLRKLVRNMIYDGVLAHLLSVDLECLRAALFKQFGERKAKAAEMNWKAVLVGKEFAEQKLPGQDSFRLEPMNANEGKFIIEGNAAAALGCMFAGVTVVTWYPITPSSSLVESLIEYMRRFRRDPENGLPTYAIVQAEDELAAIGMVIGASWAGARAMTATSGPGVSLMSEFAGLSYYTEVPAVIFDVQRVGPSTGLPTRTMQGDVLKNAVLSHGDTRHPILFPSSPEECFRLAGVAFDLAEEAQTLVFVNMDLDLGMNYWMSSPFQYPDGPFRRGKLLTAEQLDQVKNWGRYRDPDGDGIPYRTLPGTRHPKAAYFTRGSGHDEDAKYTERPEDYVRNMNRLARKFETIRRLAPKPEVFAAGSAEAAFLYYGTSRYAVEEARDLLREEFGTEVGCLRLLAYPFSDEVYEFIAQHERVYVIDQNRDGQMWQLLRMDAPAELATRLRSIRHYNGLPLDARSVIDEFRNQEGR